MKKCPFCAEEIQEEAIKCKHCGEFLKETNQSETLKRSENNWAMWCHLSTLSGIIIPFGNLIAPLVVWVLKREEYPLVDDQGKESLNFQISLCLYFIAGILLCFIVIGFFLLIVLVLFALIHIIKAALSASNGEPYRYPFCIRFIK